jgi:hypothetical protein
MALSNDEKEMYLIFCGWTHEPITMFGVTSKNCYWISPDKKTGIPTVGRAFERQKQFECGNINDK